MQNNCEFFNVPEEPKNSIERTCVSDLFSVLPRVEGSAKTTRTGILFGVNGCGKTRAALKFIYKNQDNYSAIFWLISPLHDYLLSSFSDKDILEKLELNISTDSPKEILSAIQKYVHKQSKPALFVVDKTSSWDEFNELFLPRNADIIGLTIYEPLNWPVDFKIKISGFLDQESRDLFCKLCNIEYNTYMPEEKHKLDEFLSNTLSNYPLAIVQAAYEFNTKSSKSTIEKIDEYKQQIRPLLSKKREIANHSDSAAAALLKHICHLEQDTGRFNKTFRKILDFCTFLNNNNIPIDILSDFFIANKLTSGKDEFSEAVEQLSQALIIELSANKKTFSLFGLIQTINEEKMEINAKQHNLINVINFISQHFQRTRVHYHNRINNAFEQSLYQHAKVAAEHGMRLGIRPYGVAKLFNSCGRFAHRSYKLEQEEKYYNHAYNILHTFFVRIGIFTDETLENYAVLDKEIQELIESSPNSEVVINAIQFFATETLHNLATVQKNQHWAEARPNLKTSPIIKLLVLSNRLQEIIIRLQIRRWKATNNQNEYKKILQDIVNRQFTLREAALILGKSNNKNIALNILHALKNKGDKDNIYTTHGFKEILYNDIVTVKIEAINAELKIKETKLITNLAEQKVVRSLKESIKNYKTAVNATYTARNKNLASMYRNLARCSLLLHRSEAPIHLYNSLYYLGLDKTPAETYLYAKTYFYLAKCYEKNSLLKLFFLEKFFSCTEVIDLSSRFFLTQQIEKLIIEKKLYEEIGKKTQMIGTDDFYQNDEYSEILNYVDHGKYREARERCLVTLITSINSLSPEHFSAEKIKLLGRLLEYCQYKFIETHIKIIKLGDLQKQKEDNEEKLKYINNSLQLKKRLRDEQMRLKKQKHSIEEQQREIEIDKLPPLPRKFAEIFQQLLRIQLRHAIDLQDNPDKQKKSKFESIVQASAATANLIPSEVGIEGEAFGFGAGGNIGGIDAAATAKEMSNIAIEHKKSVETYHAHRLMSCFDNDPKQVSLFLEKFPKEVAFNYQDQLSCLKYKDINRFSNKTLRRITSYIYSSKWAKEDHPKLNFFKGLYFGTENDKFQVSKKSLNKIQKQEKPMFKKITLNRKKYYSLEGIFTRSGVQTLGEHPTQYIRYSKKHDKSKKYGFHYEAHNELFFKLERAEYVPKQTQPPTLQN